MRNRSCNAYLNQLMEVPLFRGLGNRELALVQQLVTPVTVQPREVLTVEGASGRQAFVILSGHAEVTVGGRAIARLGPGEVVGEMAVIEKRPRTATVSALEEMMILVVDPGAFATLLSQPTVARCLLDTEISRLRAADAATTSPTA